MTLRIGVFLLALCLLSVAHASQQHSELLKRLPLELPSDDMEKDLVMADLIQTMSEATGGSHDLHAFEDLLDALEAQLVEEQSKDNETHTERIAVYSQNIAEIAADERADAAIYGGKRDAFEHRERERQDELDLLADIRALLNRLLEQQKAQLASERAEAEAARLAHIQHLLDTVNRTESRFVKFGKNFTLVLEGDKDAFNAAGGRNGIKADLAEAARASVSDFVVHKVWYGSVYMTIQTTDAVAARLEAWFNVLVLRSNELLKQKPATIGGMDIRSIAPYHLVQKSVEHPHGVGHNATHPAPTPATAPVNETAVGTPGAANATSANTTATATANADGTVTVTNANGTVEVVDAANATAAGVPIVANATGAGNVTLSPAAAAANASAAAAANATDDVPPLVTPTTPGDDLPTEGGDHEDPLEPELVATPDACHGGALLHEVSGRFTDGTEEDKGYSNHANCRWTIDVSDQGDDAVVQLDFTRFDVEAFYDQVYVYDGDNDAAHTLGTFTGKRSPFTLTSTGPRVMIHFVSDFSITNTGFEVVWHTVDADDVDASPCRGTGVVLKKQTGTFSDGSYADQRYDNYRDCRWLLDGSTRGDVFVRLNFERFHTEHGYDFVTVYDGPTADSAILGRFSGEKEPFVLESTASRVLVHFTSDYIIAEDGFDISYEFVLNPAEVIPALPLSNNVTVPANATAASNATIVAAGNATAAAAAGNATVVAAGNATIAAAGNATAVAAGNATTTTTTTDAAANATAATTTTTDAAANATTTTEDSYDSLNDLPVDDSADAESDDAEDAGEEPAQEEEKPFTEPEAPHAVGTATIPVGHLAMVKYQADKSVEILKEPEAHATIANGELQLDSQSSGAEAWTWVGNTWAERDLIVEFDIDFGHTDVGIGRHGGVTLFGSEMSHRWSSSFGGYTFDYFGRSKSYRVIRWDQGSPIHITDFPSEHLARHWRIVVKGGKMYFNGDNGAVRFCSGDKTYNAGWIGFWSSYGQYVHVSNVHIGKPARSDENGWVAASINGVERTVPLKTTSGRLAHTDNDWILVEACKKEGWTWMQNQRLSAPYTLSALVRGKGGKGRPGHGGFFVHAANQTQRYEKAQRGYSFDYFDRDSTYRVIKWVDGKPEHVADVPVAAEQVATAWKVVVTEDSITWIGDGKEIASIKSVFSEGYVGFFAWEGDTLSVSDIVVSTN